MRQKERPHQPFAESYVDTHVHFASIDSPGNKKHPRKLLHKAQALGIDWVAISDHGKMTGVPRMTRLAKKYEIGIIPAFEGYSFVPQKRVAFSLPGLPTIQIVPQMPHVVALMDSIEKVPFARSVEYFGEYVHKKGGILIAAHPKSGGDFESLAPEQVVDYFKQGHIDAVETKSRGSCIYDMEMLADRYNIPQVGSSDSHRVDPRINRIGRSLYSYFGTSATGITVPVYTSKDVIRAIKNNNCFAIEDITQARQTIVFSRDDENIPRRRA